MLIEVNGKRAVRINAIEKARSKNKLNILLDCEGEDEPKWFPVSTVEVEDGGTVKIQEWKYNQSFS